MTRNNILLGTLLLLLGALCFYVYKDRIFPPPIQISHRFVEPRGAMLRRAKNSTVDSVIFLIDRELKLKSVKVIAITDAATNKNPHALWELISDSNSVPVKQFVYGLNVRGMRPAVKGKGADPLQPGIAYRLLVASGSHKIEHDFTPVPR